MKERRKFPRSPLPLKAAFFGVNGWENCTVNEVSRKGMGVLFLTPVGLHQGSIIHLKVLLPREAKPVTVRGILKWIKNNGDFFIGGIEWFRINNSPTRITN
jgi:hypothetical protein